MGQEFTVLGFRLRVLVMGFGCRFSVLGLRFRVLGVGFSVLGFFFYRVECLTFKVQGFWGGFWV